jgi:hypothetical protein
MKLEAPNGLDRGGDEFDGNMMVMAIYSFLKNQICGFTF